MKLPISLLLSLSAIAGPVSFMSGDGHNEGNDFSFTNVVVDPHARWSQPTNGAHWVNCWGSGWPANSSATPVGAGAALLVVFVCGVIVIWIATLAEWASQ